MKMDLSMSGRNDVLDLMIGLRARRQAYALATVVETTGATSAKPGAKAIMAEDGAVLAGWVGGGCAEAAVREAALECLRDGAPKVIELDLDDEVLGTGMPCGGTMRVYVEPAKAQPTLWVLGHGKVAECLCRFAATLGLRIVVDDPLADNPERYPDATELIHDDYSYEGLTPAAGDFVVIATQYKGDHLSTVIALRSPARYIAVIASAKRARLMREYLLQQGFSHEELTRIYAPAGLSLGAETPEEIALSVVAEIVMRRRGGIGLSMRPEDEPLADLARSDVAVPASDRWRLS
jgi:xanthine dehydrogenase accessory factor